MLSKPTEQAARSACRQSYRGDKYYLKINECLPRYLGPLITDLIVRNPINGFEINMRSLFRCARCDVRSIHGGPKSFRVSNNVLIKLVFEIPVLAGRRSRTTSFENNQVGNVLFNMQFNEKKLSYRINIARRRSLCRRSRSFTDFGTNRKPVCNFLLVNNTNLLSIAVSQYIAQHCSNSRHKSIGTGGHVSTHESLGWLGRQ